MIAMRRCDKLFSVGLQRWVNVSPNQWRRAFRGPESAGWQSCEKKRYLVHFSFAYPLPTGNGAYIVCREYRPRIYFMAEDL